MSVKLCFSSKNPPFAAVTAMQTSGIQESLPHGSWSTSHMLYWLDGHFLCTINQMTKTNLLVMNLQLLKPLWVWVLKRVYCFAQLVIQAWLNGIQTCILCKVKTTSWCFIQTSSFSFFYLEYMAADFVFPTWWRQNCSKTVSTDW